MANVHLNVIISSRIGLFTQDRLDDVSVPQSKEAEVRAVLFALSKAMEF